MKTIVTALITALMLSPNLSLAQDDDSILILPGKPFPKPTLDQCKTALERGRIVKTDEEGFHHIAFDGFYFLIEVDQNQLRCRIFRHVSGT